MQSGRVIPLPVSLSPGNPVTLDLAANDAQRTTYSFTVNPVPMSLNVTITDLDGSTFYNQTFLSGVSISEQFSRAASITFAESNATYSFVFFYKKISLFSADDIESASFNQGIQITPYITGSASAQGLSFAAPVVYSATTNAPVTGSFTSSFVSTGDNDAIVVLGTYSTAPTFGTGGTLNVTIDGNLVGTVTTTTTPVAGKFASLWQYLNLAAGTHSVSVGGGTAVVSASNTGAFYVYVICVPHGGQPFVGASANYGSGFSGGNLTAYIGNAPQYISLPEITGISTIWTAIPLTGISTDAASIGTYSYEDENDNIVGVDGATFPTTTGTVNMSGISASPTSLTIVPSLVGTIFAAGDFQMLYNSITEFTA